jgi:hypothetical protein
LASYVKFRRGTPAEYLATTHKDSDTLYFITEQDKSVGYLYLGEKLIAGGETGGLVEVKLDDLTDVIIKTEELKDKSFLIYDTNEKNWVNVELDDLIFRGATSLSAGGAGLVPAPASGQEKYFLRGDGVWAPVAAAPAEVIETATYEATIAKGQNHIEAINSIVGSNSLNSGDIAVVKELIAEDKYQYTAYVFDNTWKAMDGNYDADNVYFDEDILVTAPIGTIQTLTNGQATLSAKGKSLSEVLSSLMAERKNPTATNPSATIELINNSNKSYLVEIGTEITPKWQATFSKGSYTYGPETGCESTVAIVELVDTENGKEIAAGALNGASGTLDVYRVADETQRKLKLTYGYTASAANAKDNFGDETDISISSASELTTYSKYYVQGYRNSFYGTYSSKDGVGDTSDSIRTLRMSGKTLGNGDTFTMEIPVGAMRVVIAYPAILRDMSEVLDKNDSDTNIVSAFGDPQIISIESANGFDSVDYKVYILNFANPYDAVNVYTVKI